MPIYMSSAGRTAASADVFPRLSVSFDVAPFESTSQCTCACDVGGRLIGSHFQSLRHRWGIRKLADGRIGRLHCYRSAYPTVMTRTGRPHKQCTDIETSSTPV